MKRLISFALSLVMVLSTAATVMADTIAGVTSFVPNPHNQQLLVQVLGRETGGGDFGSAGSYTAALPLTRPNGGSVGVDYKTTLDMAPIRNLFTEPIITSVLMNDATLKDEFEAGVISTTITVDIQYPTAEAVSNTITGTLNAGSIFSEVSRNVGAKSTVITYKNEDNLTVGALKADLAAHSADAATASKLKDIDFILDGQLNYNTDGYHQVTVTLTGTSTITFASKTQTVQYYGTSSHIATITEEAAPIVFHVLEIVPAIPPTCTVSGTTQGVKCSTHNSYDCDNDDDDDYDVQGIIIPETIPALGHDPANSATIVDVSGVPATCASTGIVEHKTCILCKQDFVLDGNSYVEVAHSALITPRTNAHTEVVIPAVAATCVKGGSTQGRYCSICGMVIATVNYTSPNGHTAVPIPAVAATCTTEGKTEGSKCSVCGLVLTAQKNIEPLGHSFGAWSETPATQTSTGLKTRSCTRGCGYTERVVIPKLAHTHVIDERLTVITPATCTTPGSKQTYCACGAAVGDPVVIKPSHKLSQVPAIPATCAADGVVAHHVCTVCDAKFRDAAGKVALNSVTLPKNPDNHAAGNAKIKPIPATCTTFGLTEGEKCKGCNIVIKKQNVVPKKAHTFEFISTEPAKCEETGLSEHYHCAECDEDFDLHHVRKDHEYFVIPALGHLFNGVTTVDVRPTDDATGVGHMACTRGCGFSKEVTIAKRQHVHTEITEEIIVPETCLADGVKRQRHSCCGGLVDGKDNIVIPKHAHTLILKNQVNPTCFTTGTGAYYECTECHKMFSHSDSTKEIIAPDTLGKTGHDFVERNGGTEKYCTHCGEIIHIVKEVDNPVDINVGTHGGMKDEMDHHKENTSANVEVKSNINIKQRDEISEELDEMIPDDATTEKIVYDITVEKLTIVNNNTANADKELVPETDDLIEVIINIPSSIQGKAQYNVLRKHGNQKHKITETANADGEYFVLDTSTWKIILHVKKFSEYAVVAFDEVTEIVEPETPATPSGGSGAVTMFTVKYNTNGGTVIEDMTVKYGDKAVHPETKRDGYTFIGWYKDIACTQLYDFSTPVYSNMTLYAKWEENPDKDPSSDGWYIDVPEKDWYYEAVKFVDAKGIMNGISSDEFAPNMPLTRAMFVTILYRIESEPAALNSIFEDVEINTWYNKAVAWATTNGITKGVSETEFAPDRIIIREQIAAMLHRYATFKGYDVSASESDSLNAFIDADTVTEYAVPSFKWAVAEGILKGRSEITLNPAENATRAEAAALIMRLMQKYSK